YIERLYRVGVSARCIGHTTAYEPYGAHSRRRKEQAMAKRSQILELAVLGLLHEHPMHGYELRRQLNVQLGAFRALSYGTLYPCLKDLVARGWIAEDDTQTANVAASRRAKISYKLTAEGKERFQELMTTSGSAAWE